MCLLYPINMDARAVLKSEGGWRIVEDYTGNLSWWNFISVTLFQSNYLFERP